MPKFFLHLRQGKILTDDRNGGEFASLSAAVKEALYAAREILAEEMRSGMLTVEGVSIEVCNEKRQLLWTLPFKGAFAVG
jgi:hypothetical protein